ncbi:MAG: hypothetical protein IT580_16895 [Verrucomicrobiales bacterium]|nr:hypothetical protein [Verrucomicrobiales bacterium]
MTATSGPAAPGAVESAPSHATVGLVDPAGFRRHVEAFNRADQETVTNLVPNAAAWTWLSTHVPWFECSSPELEEIYAFRWWTYRKHLKQTTDGYLITEFLPPVPWSGKHNSISCPAGHHFYEGRWIRDPRYLDDYASFWFRRGGEPRKYSFWAADALWARSMVLGNDRVAQELLPDLMANYEAWDRSRRDASGLYWQEDGQDGMEVSLGGTGCRATINSYQYGDALAIARLAERTGQTAVARAFRERAAEIKRLVQEQLWDPAAEFFKVRPRGATALADVRELHGYTPWYFHLPDPDRAVAWRQLMDPRGFYAPFGPTTAEQRHPRFSVKYEGHECQWNGPSWPLATSITLTALANLLNDGPQEIVSRGDYWATFQCYLRSHRFRQLPPELAGASTLERRETRQPWIDENLNPFTGDWIARTLLKQRKQAPDERGKDYNHSTFCDLVITGLVGLRPRMDERLEVNPLLPEGALEWFCLDRVRYHGRDVTILYDRTGARYGRGPGLQVLVEGRVLVSSPRLARLEAELPRSSTNQEAKASP